ncbi:hypothetical protein BV25DRAFT_1914782 [Artomyces pyxidatus]|uniref:Uncharacterized protein n=1 Tax=Artomyces pyxidatus TaxID=48021 RepID=A0ACB8T7A6_9AGAM|nr:hypothetical protein BV25DRAFT_1914782 [Artomyces pyxidatus]
MSLFPPSSASSTADPPLTMVALEASAVSSSTLILSQTDLPPDDDRPEVSTFLSDLIEDIAHTISTLRRNTTVSYELLDRATRIYGRVMTLKCKFKKEGSWDTYDKVMTPSLHSSITVEDEAHLYLASTASVNKWEDNRKALYDGLENLYVNETRYKRLFDTPLKSEAAKVAEKEGLCMASKYDDIAFFTDLHKHIKPVR